MAEKHPFRSAFNGFHREDVVHYIEYLNSRHNSQIQQLQSELQQLQEKLSKSTSAPRQDPLTLQILAKTQAERDEFRTRAEELQARCTELEAQLAKAAEEPAGQEQLEQVRREADERVAAAMEQVADLRRNADRELEAYRRAERTERIARERAEQVYRQANAAISNASSYVQSAADQVGVLADQVLSQLEQLRQTVAGSKDALCTAAGSLRPIEPEED